MNALVEKLERETFEEMRCRRVYHGVSADQPDDDTYRNGIRLGVIVALAALQERHPDIDFRVDQTREG